MPRHSSRSEYIEESRERDYYPASSVGGRGNRVTEYEEIDIRERRGGRERDPEFLRDDYARSSAGPLVVRERDEEIIEEKGRKGGRRRHGGGGREIVEEEEIIVKRGGGGREREREREREPPREREVVKEEEVIIRKGGRERREPIQHEEIREEFIYKPRERSPPVLAREKEEWVFAPRRRAKSYEREERREEREPPRSYEKEEIIIRRDEREEERPRNRGYEREELIIRRDERSKSRERPRPREPSYDREEVIIRRDEREGGRDRGYREDEFISIRRGEPERPRPKRESSFEREEVIIRRGDTERPRPKRESSFEREEVIIRRDERERPRERPKSRERDYREEDITIRRDERGGGRETEQIIIRRGERERESEPSEPEPEPIPIPIPEPMPIRAPPIHQEIITHHRHIDHGFENRAPMPAPLPPPTVRREPSRSPSPKSAYDEIEIRRRGEHNGRRYDDDIVIDTRRKVSNDHPYENRTPRRRSPSMETRSRYDPIAEEEDFYARKTAERAYIGEAYNGATKDWAIVDVPPGTNRVKMNGVGGASQEVTWQRYNGVRRSKFIVEDDGGGYGSQMEERTPERGLDKGRRFVAMKPKTEAMWTEITKDLVIKEAIEGMGYDFEETEFFYYVMEYLRYVSLLSSPSCLTALPIHHHSYLRLPCASPPKPLYTTDFPPPPSQEDVLRLVEISEDLRRERRERIRAIEWERAHEPEPEPERPRRMLAAEPWDEERIYEREIVYDRPPPPAMPPIRREVREKVYVMR
ncbi:hypothetical protein MMC15_006413 [Xylographa vitiligo]|nr:hypothetical protein [Xylographa vitiligo]